MKKVADKQVLACFCTTIFHTNPLDFWNTASDMRDVIKASTPPPPPVQITPCPGQIAVQCPHPGEITHSILCSF